MKFLTVDSMNLTNLVVTVAIAIIACISCIRFMKYRAYKCEFTDASCAWVTMYRTYQCKFTAISSSGTLMVMVIFDFICYFKEDIAANDMFQQIWWFIVMMAFLFNIKTFYNSN